MIFHRVLLFVVRYVFLEEDMERNPSSNIIDITAIMLEKFLVDSLHDISTILHPMMEYHTSLSGSSPSYDQYFYPLEVILMKAKS